MRFLNSIIVFLLVAGFSAAASADVIKYDNAWDDAGFTIAEKGGFGVEVTYCVEQVAINDLQVNGKTMKTINIPGVLLPNNPGAPNLPGESRMIAIPNGATASVNILRMETEIIRNIEIAPAAEIPFENDDSPPVYLKNQSIYSRNSLYPENAVVLSEPRKLRGVDYVLLGITPFQYNPVTKELTIYKNLELEVVFNGGTGQFGDNRLRSRYWEPILKSNLSNYSSLPRVDFNNNLDMPLSDTDLEYIIIVPDDPAFIAWADTIKNWRQLQGIRTGVVPLTEIGGNSTSAIENYINNAYNTWTIPPSAVLLLSDYQSSGDAYGITSPYWNGYCVSDNIYADVDNDDLPDVALARITAQNETHLSEMVNKFLDYERTPPTDPGFYQYPITAGGWQTERWFILCTEICWGFMHNVLGKDPVREYAIYYGTPGSTWSTNQNTYMLVNYFGPGGLGYIPSTPEHLNDWGGNATRINNDINSGAFLLLHRDHGAETGWGEPSYWVSDLSGLNNDMLPFVLSINCLTGKYNWGSQCFTEAFHRMQNGALGLIAASEVSYSFVNDTYIFGLYDYLWPNFDPGYGESGEAQLNPCFANASGKYYLQASSWPYNPQHKVYTHHLFHHHGDAFNTIYSEIPQNLSVSHAAELQEGANSFTVTADDGSLIGLTVNGEIVGVADGTGSAVDIPITPQMAGATMIVTVTKPNYYRYEQSIPVTGGSSIYADFSGDPTSGCSPLIVNFTDLSTGEITAWQWDFGDGGTSTVQNPSYTYNNPGIYTVTLTVSGPEGSDTETKADYISVYESPVAG
ncbi:MAG: PKD domain-containing protein, partial [candidate division Zixibacteria bacterium]|nr:PKD domain-containing protein [candidate division Zixibacteria bacterium]